VSNYQLKGILKEKYRRKVNKGVLFLHDNALAHWALATQKKLAHLGFQCLDDLPCSPDLAPLDYHMFARLKKTIERLSVFVHMEVIAAMET
jgi:histone-lysine N-methyltransferase SETMAR